MMISFKRDHDIFVQIWLPGIYLTIIHFRWWKWKVQRSLIWTSFGPFQWCSMPVKCWRGK